MYIISISGLDGSGKSTQIKLLENYLKSQGKRVFYFHAVNFSIGNRIFEILRLCHSERSEKSRSNRVVDNPTGLPRRSYVAPRNDNKPKSVTHANWLQIQLRKIALRIDIWRFKKMAKKLEKQGCDYILSDRFFYDTIININYLENKNSKIQNSKFKIHSKFKIQNSLSIYLQTSSDLIMNRERVPDQGLEYLQKKKGLYDKKIKEFNFTVINGNRDKDVIFEEIRNRVTQNA